MRHEEVHTNVVLAVNALRADASKRFWLWQGEDIEQAKRIFRLRFGKESGEFWKHGEMKGVLEGHILFALDRDAIMESES